MLVNSTGNHDGSIPSTKGMPSLMNRYFFTGKMIVNLFEMKAETLACSAAVLLG
jgi:hypothetical protein